MKNYLLIFLFFYFFFNTYGQNLAYDSTFAIDNFGARKGWGVPNGKTFIELSNGKILISGSNPFSVTPPTYFSYTSYPYDHVGITRLFPDGNVDTSFLSPFMFNSQITSIVELSNQKYVVCGSLYPPGSVDLPSNNRPAFALNDDGTIDNSFYLSYYTGNLSKVIKLSNNSLVFISDNSLIALNETGSALNPALNFGTGGNLPIKDFIELSSGKFIVSGAFTVYNGVNCKGIIRLNSDGTVDPTFITTYGTELNSAFIYEAKVQSTGKIVAAGQFTVDNYNHYSYVVRFNSNGTFDTSFDTDSSYYQTAKTIEILPTDTIYVGGEITTYGNKPITGFCKIFPNGGIDTTFLPQERFDVTFSSYHPEINEIRYLNNSLYLSGYYNRYDSLPAFHILKMDLQGNRDFNFPHSEGLNQSVKHIEQLNSGSILVTGDFSIVENNSRNKIALFNNDGSLDLNFNPGTGFDLDVNGIFEKQNGKILIWGDFTNYNSTSVNKIFMLNVDGSIDNNFNFIHNGTIKSIIEDEFQNLLIGGTFTLVNGQSVNGLVTVDDLGQIETSIAPILPPTESFSSMAYSPDGKLLINTLSSPNNFTYVINNNGSLYYKGEYSSFEITKIKFFDDSTIVCLSYNSYSGNTSCQFLNYLDTTQGYYYTWYSPYSIYSFNTIYDIDVEFNKYVYLATKFDDTTSTSNSLTKSVGRLDLNEDSGWNYSTDFYGDVESIQLDGNGGLLCGGYFYGVGSTNRNCLTRLLVCNDYTTEEIENCGDYTWNNGITYTQDTYGPTITYINQNGCDSIVKLKLDVFESFSYIDTFLTCNEYYDWNTDSLYTLTTIIYDTSYYPNGCVSEYYETYIQIIPPVFDTINITNCSYFMWINGESYSHDTIVSYTIASSFGCDSTITMNFTHVDFIEVNTSFVSPCQSYFLSNGTQITTPGIYTDSLYSYWGCDSIVTIDLTFSPLSQDTLIINQFVLPSSDSPCNGYINLNSNTNVPTDLYFGSTIYLEDVQFPLIFDTLCSGIYDLWGQNECSNNTNYSLVIPQDSNFIFINPFSDSLAIDSLGYVSNNCTIFYSNIDSVYIDTIFENSGLTYVVWNIIDANGIQTDTSIYDLQTVNGVIWLQLSVFCPIKSNSDFFTFTQAVYFENGQYLLEPVQNSSSIAENLYLQEFSISPNPFTNNIIINSKEDLSIRLILFDQFGRICYNNEIQTNTNIDFCNFSNGMYNWQIIYNNKLSRGKLIK